MDYNKEYFKNILPKRPENSYKGTFGHVLNIAGSRFYSGAAYFSSISALKAGCGLATLASTETVLKSVSALSPDVILMPLEETNEKTISPKAIKQLKPILNNYQVISVGCGLYTNKDTIKFFKELIAALNKLQTPVIIDADGLNILSFFTLAPCGRGDRGEGCHLPQNTILTPHPKELSRIMGVNTEEILSQPEFWIKKCCEKYGCTVVLKMHQTMVADSKGNFYINNTGNSALSHGGSGDVLCGMISGFVASGSRSELVSTCEKQVEQGELNDSDVRVCNNKLYRSNHGINLFDACCLGVYLHGIAGEIASQELTEYSTLSSDLINYIPKAIKTLT